MPTPPSPPEVLRTRLDRVKDIIRTAGTQVGHIAQVVAEFGLSRSRACEVIAEARKELGDALPIADTDLDALYMAAMLDAATDPDEPAAERRRTWADIMRMRGRYRQIAFADALATSPPPADLSDPAVLAAALALDEAISAKAPACIVPPPS